MVFSGEIGQQFYAQEMAVAIPGLIIGMGQYYAGPYSNTASAVQGVYTITPPATVDANTTYSLSINNNVVSFTTGSSTTTAQLGQGLLNAIRASGTVFRSVDAAVNVSTGVITLTSRFYNTPIVITSPSNANTTNDLTIATATAPGSLTNDIPYGRFVGRTSADSIAPVSGFSPARLINATSGFTVLGVTMKTFQQKNAIGPNAKAMYPLQDTLSVLEDCVGIQGIWTECVETDITPNDTLYIATTAGNEGKVTKTSTSAINFSSRARFINSTQLDPNGNPIVGVYLKRM